MADTWNADSDNQLVTNKAVLNAISLGVFSLNSGQSVPDDREVMRKSEALLRLSIDSSNPFLASKASNQVIAKRDLIRNFTYATLLYGIPVKFQFNGWNTSLLACGNYSTAINTTVFHDDPIAVNTVIYGYYIGGITTGRWYYIDGYAIQISANPTYNSTTLLYNATISTATSCGSAPSSGVYLADRYTCSSCNLLEQGILVKGVSGLTINNFYTGNDLYTYKITSTSSGTTDISVSGSGFANCSSVPCI